VSTSDTNLDLCTPNGHHQQQVLTLSGWFPRARKISKVTLITHNVRRAMLSKAASVIVLAGCCLLSAGPGVRAADSISNSLRGFTGYSDLTHAGFVLTDPFGTDNAILLGTSGVTFGSYIEGDFGRNYLRTIAADYATVNMEALITIDVLNANQQAYFGLGSGEIALWGTPDWSTQFSSVSAWIADPSQLVTFRTQDDTNEFYDVTGTPITGTHRVRMVFDSEAKTMMFSIDLNYSGGAFTADVSAPAVDVSTLFGPTGWPTEPACIFFGGDDAIVFSDLVVNANSPPRLGMVNMPPNSVSLTWSADAASYQLQQNHFMGSTNWTGVTNVPLIVSGENQVTLMLNQSNRFFRLIYP